MNIIGFIGNAKKIIKKYSYESNFILIQNPSNDEIKKAFMIFIMMDENKDIQKEYNKCFKLRKNFYVDNIFAISNYSDLSGHICCFRKKKWFSEELSAKIDQETGFYTVEFIDKLYFVKKENGKVLNYMDITDF